ncbi:Short chain dehydrogenase sol3 [Apiospora kogelbergensis]|uniref:Short chain dehydrogenase sol3 n=1 Tax=Apiospora kogelbergensis TaxID=1337665 RepID=UPI003130B736
MAQTQEVTPQKEGSIPSYLHRQLFFTPKPVAGVSLEGKTAIVTGSNCGVGLECSRQLLDLGITKLILAVRSQARGQAAAEELARDRSLAAGRSIDVWELDHLSYDSVRAFAGRARSLDRLDLVVLNAGTLPAAQTINPHTGHDEGVQVNYLSTSLLLVLLLDVIKSKPESQPARITITSSDGAAWTKFAEKKNRPLLASLDKPEGWSAIDRQFLSKLLVQFFVSKLATVVPASVAVVNMATPGMVHDSNMNRETKAQLASKIVEPLRRMMGYTSAVAARLIVDAAVNHGPESHGRYLSEQRIKPMAPIVYTEEGQALKDQIWDETLAEFGFANMGGIINGLAGASSSATK